MTEGMRDVAQRALDTAVAAGAGYCDVRYLRTRHQEVAVKEGKVDGLSQEESEGLGVRVLVDDAWGFACTSRLSGPDVDATAARAISVARASGSVHKQPVDLGPPAPAKGSYSGAMEVDPFSVSLDDKIALLMEAESRLRTEDAIRVAEASAECTHWQKLLLSSDGADVEQEAYETGAGLEAVALSPDDMQKRSYPNSFGRQVGQGGWELVEAMDLAGNAPRIAEEAAALLSAERCPSGVTTVVLDSDQVCLQVHESCGHPVELDRVFGDEAAYAGTSFMTPDLLGNLKYGSEVVSIVADATVPGALGTFGWDDEGVPAQRVELVDHGMFVGYLTSRETATRLGKIVTARGPGAGGASMGSMRAEDWSRIPLIRMTNINLQPGDSTLEEMIEGTKEGVLMRTNKSWSIDDKRLNFQFGTEIGYEIKDGKLGRMYRNPTYAGITPEFWNSCDAVGRADQWRLFGLINCGKGQPGQTMRVGHGAPPARFRDVRVGIA